MRRLARISGYRAAMLWILPVFGLSADQSLVDFAKKGDVAAAKPLHASLRQVQSPDGQPSLQVTTQTNVPWPGARITLPGAPVNLSAFDGVRVTLFNPGPDELTIYARVANPPQNSTSRSVGYGEVIGPHSRDSFVVRLARIPSASPKGRLFGMHSYPPGFPQNEAIDVSKVSVISVVIPSQTVPRTFNIEKIEAVGAAPVNQGITLQSGKSFFPFVDRYGQFEHKDWPGKIKSDQDLQQHRIAEEADLAKNPGPEDRSTYGGWARGPKMSATGFFHVLKNGNKWWLVDPEGYLFWSHGVNSVGYSDPVRIDQRQDWFDDFPGNQGEFAEFITKNLPMLKAKATTEKSSEGFPFSAANLKRKYGPEWRTTYAMLIDRRMRSWGLNTIANFISPDFMPTKKTPYVDWVQSQAAPKIEGSEGPWGKFPDVFDERFAANYRAEMERKKKTTAEDPYCIGYFSDNELAWGSPVYLAEAVLRSPGTQPAKRAFADALKAKYEDVATLNKMWGSSYNSWEDFLSSTNAPSEGRARTDLENFTKQLAEKYFQTARDAIKQAAPHHLYLGCRFAAPVNPIAAEAAGRFCDVVSFNKYQKEVQKFNGGITAPILITEFQFGAPDRGLFNPGMVVVQNEDERGTAYRKYVEGALKNPQIVGTHWFLWRDEPLIGRFYDGENMLSGLVDEADTPYPELIAAVRDVGQHLYQIRSGQ